ncbi:probable F-box protein At1g44080 isoform X1 [Coffea arabica]|uniref:F-box protein At5g55150 isoform X1 n=2 Tax=Coffea arabica TaxID=13443 RepID=A0A6P6U2Z2_COFAR|nr:putative F-box protein At5g55150 isoform X1 [Coffea arabica]XP_027084875.1 putative F-box protein At5g55150 isoform X1 [Coffea arabica]XP_027084876.1 putative F-box protein At5g55150 isoform X1 [Coffea arabica]
MGDSVWSSLLPDLLVSIAIKIQLVEDFMAFRGVCTSWRAAAHVDKFVKSWPKVPLLMLAEKEDSDDREFYSLSRGRIWRTLSLPEAKGKKCIESRGWLMTIGKSGDVNLLHPFSGVQIELPHLSTFPAHELEVDPCFFVIKAVLSASPSHTSEFVLVVVGGAGRFLGFWRPGVKSWTRMESSPNGAFNDVNFYNGAFNDVNFYNGKCYAITYGGDIWVWDISDPTAAHYGFTIDRELIKFRESYLVESDGELLIVARDGAALEDDDEETYGATNFRVIQLDLIKRGWKEITNVGERAIFVGHNGAFSIDATSFPNVIKPNCIYFTDDAIEAYTFTQQGGGKDMGVYNLEDGGRIERFDGVQSFSLIGPPVWVAPSF